MPISINPDGNYVLGSKIGRRSADLVLLGLDGKTRAHKRLPYAWPDPVVVLRWLEDTTVAFRATVPTVAGLGIALPSRLWDWAEEVPEGQIAMQAWRDIDLVATFGATGLPVMVVNDGAAACAAEMTFGTLPHGDEVLYVFVGTFIGGGLASRGSLVLGASGNAGSFGSVLVQGSDGVVQQLIDVASLIGLERALRAKGQTAEVLRLEPTQATLSNPLVDRWITQAAHGIAQAMISAVATTDSRLVIVDGAMPAEILDVLVARVAAFMPRYPLAGIDVPTIQRGTIGPLARAIGAASVVLNERFLAWPADIKGQAA
ncbi:ROK family protein [Pseudotabrizicola sediminis]|uniref:ROK family protein n=1 Tax=Pseudotabrizicola sediminis TaxID=2486418 RepID=UPI0014367BCB|nr:ROK family protein [Pseudotabrizicola sediminis]